MAIININERTLSFIFSIARDRGDNGEWAVRLTEEHVHRTKKGIDLRIGSIQILDINWTNSSTSAATKTLNETALKNALKATDEQSVIPSTAYRKVLRALEAFKASPDTALLGEEGLEVLRLTNTFEIKDDALNGRTAIFHTIERDASGQEKSTALAFTAENVARYASQICRDKSIINSDFYYTAAEKTGDDMHRMTYLDLMRKPQALVLKK